MTTPNATEGKKTVNYVDKQKFYELIVERKELLKENPDLPITDELAENIIAIASNLQFHRNFVKYHYKDELVLDAIENCLRYFDNFDPTKSKNPFGYFTQIAWFAFLRRIKKEYSYKELKESVTEKSEEYNSPFYVQDHDLNEAYPNPSVDFKMNHEIFVDKDLEEPQE